MYFCHHRESKWKCIQYFIVQLYQWMPYLSSTELNKISSSYRPVGYEYASESLCLNMFDSDASPFHSPLLNSYVTQPRFSTHLFQGSRKAAFSSSVPLSCPLLSPFYMPAQTVQHQPLFTLAILLSLIEYYQIPHAGEEKETEPEDHVVLMTKKVHLSTLCWLRYELQFHCWRGCVPLQS